MGEEYLLFFSESLELALQIFVREGSLEGSDLIFRSFHKYLHFIDALIPHLDEIRLLMQKLHPLGLLVLKLLSLRIGALLQHPVGFIRLLFDLLESLHDLSQLLDFSLPRSEFRLHVIRSEILRRFADGDPLDVWM